MLFTISNATKVGNKGYKNMVFNTTSKNLFYFKNLSACLHLTALKNKKR